MNSTALCRHVFAEVYCAKFTPDGRRVVSASWDAAALLNQIQANPSAYGFTDATDSALLTGHASQADTYVFWDSIHPTTAADALIANAAAVQFAPEPSALALMSLGLAGAALGRWRARRKQATEIGCGIRGTRRQP